MNILTATFGAGLTCGAGIIQWADRVEPLGLPMPLLLDYEGTVFDLMADSLFTMVSMPNIY